MREIKMNNLNSLADALINEILKNKDPFNTYIIIFPNLLLEQWFKSYWLQKSNKVLLNVNFTRIRPFISQAFGNEKPIMTNDKMALIIADILYNNDSKYQEISSYYKGNNTNLFDLSNKLSELFSKYELDCFIPSGWQKELLNEIKQNDSYTFISDIINNEVVINNKVFVFGFTKLEKLYNKALSKINDCIVYYQENIPFNEKINICGAMSKEREIEYVHDEITKLLNSDVKMYDILVYAPNVSEYEAVIKKVFSTGGDKNFPSIPYVITSGNNGASNTSEAISILYKVLVSKQFTREDFYELISNLNVCKARNIDVNSINAIIDALSKMNVYRNNQKCDEWLYGIKRLLVSKIVGKEFVNNVIELDDGKYLPYGNISLDDNTISKVVDIITDIIEFKKLENINLIKHELDKWLSYSNEYEDNFYYRQALSILTIIQDKNLNIPLDIVLKAMINASKNLNVMPSNVINGGITFVNFNEKNILSSKYMFFIGLSNNNLPRMDKNDELDLRRERESITQSDINTFNYLNANSNNKYYSFVKVNLKSLEEYQVSSFVQNYEINKTLELSERRKYSELYSKSEFNKKSYNTNLTKVKEIVKREYNPSEAPIQIKYKELSDYIEEGLKAKINKMFKGDDSSDILEKITNSYEPLEITSLVASNIAHDILYKMLETNTSDLDEELIDDVKKQYKLRHDLPYVTNDIDEQIKQAREYYKAIKPSRPIPKYTVTLDKFELVVDDEFIHTLENGIHYFYDTKVKDYKKASSFARIYIKSLSYLVKEEKNFGYDNNITISLCNKKEFQCNSNKAKEILERLYEKYTNNEMIISPIDAYNVKDYYELIASLKNKYGYWNYFSDKLLFNEREDIGVTKETFESWLNNYKQEISELVLFELEEKK